MRSDTASLPMWPRSPQMRCVRWRWPYRPLATGETAGPSQDLEYDLDLC